MIKIAHKDAVKAEKEYFNLLKTPVINRLQILKTSLNHLSGLHIDKNDLKFNSIKVVTRKIVEIIDDGKYLEAEFNKKKYDSTVENYIRGANNLSSINLRGLLKLIEFLLSDNNLKELITCKAENLESYKVTLLKNYKLENSDIPIIALAFDYEYQEINSKIKYFFRKKNFVKYCPYCNLKDIEYLETDSGNVADVHELDHFFNKINSPLLALSMYNLIPTDSTCNGKINKGSIQFFDEYHLNPYISGVGEHLKFIPKLDSVNEVQIIELSLGNEPSFRKKIIGDCHNVDEDCKQGNINVFKIKTRYKDKTDEAKRVLQKINSKQKGIRSIKGFISKLKMLKKEGNNEENYLMWYHDIIETGFKPDDFHLQRFSKFNRDIHDFYYSMDKETRNKFIHELIKNNIG